MLRPTLPVNQQLSSRLLWPGNPNTFCFRRLLWTRLLTSGQAAIKVHLSVRQQVIRQTLRKAKDMAGYLLLFSKWVLLDFHWIIQIWQHFHPKHCHLFLSSPSDGTVFYQENFSLPLCILPILVFQEHGCHHCRLSNQMERSIQFTCSVILGCRQQKQYHSITKKVKLIFIVFHSYETLHIRAIPHLDSFEVLI